VSSVCAGEHFEPAIILFSGNGRECQDCQGRVAEKEGGGGGRRDCWWPEPEDFPAGGRKRAILQPR